MASSAQTFSYTAVDASGRRVRGALTAPTEGAAFEQLKRQGLSPLRLGPARGGAPDRSRKPLSSRQASALLADLAALLQAGSDMRTSLNVIGSKAETAAARETCKILAADISAGVSLERAFTRAFGPKLAFVPALVAAGEATGDIAGALERAAELLSSRLKLIDQLVSALSYPAFILATAVVAAGVILFFVVPALAPLVQQGGSKPPLIISVLAGVSRFLRGHATSLAAGGLLSALILFILGRRGVLSRVIDWFIVDFAFRRTAARVIYGGFAISLGKMLTAGAPMGEALKLAVRSIGSPTVRRRAEAVVARVRQGQRISDVLARVRGFPQSIVRLAAIGEASGALGTMIARAGRLEEEAALRRIEAMGRFIGPAAIVVLGAMIGLLMGGLLSSLTHIGDVAIQ